MKNNKRGVSSEMSRRQFGAAAGCSGLLPIHKWFGGSGPAPDNCERPLVSVRDRRISVPGDYPSLQAVLDELPVLMRHVWKIIVTKSIDEDVIIPAYLASGLGYDGIANNLQIHGDPDSPVPMSSLLIAEPLGLFTIHRTRSPVCAQYLVPRTHVPGQRPMLPGSSGRSSVWRRRRRARPQ